MIETVIFDIGNVLVDFCWKNCLERMPFDEDTKQALAKAMFMSATWADLDRSEKTDEELLDLLVANAPEYESEIRTVFEHLDLSVKLYDFTIPWIRRLKDSGYKVYYLSNFPRKTFELLGHTMDFIEEMDGGILSFRVKLIKPEKEIYQALLEEYRITPQNAVFLDDCAANVEAAAALGLQTILVENHGQAVKELEKLGVYSESISS